MKKTLLAAALALCAIGSQSCKKDDYKPDIVKYKIDGKEYIVDQPYSGLTLFGIKPFFYDSSISLAATSEYSSPYLALGNISKFENSSSFFTSFGNDSTARMFVNIRSSSGAWSSFGSIEHHSRYCRIISNSETFIEGEFTGMLYNNVPRELASDSIHITDGYFYLNKE